jgi:hypothetical protein
MIKFIKKFKNISILILMISLFGCTDENTTYPKVVAGFTHTINEDTGTVTFINISTNATNYSWDFGDDSSSALINPVKTYPAGTYTIVLKASNVAGASNTFEDTIIIDIPIPIPVITLNGNATINVLIGGTFTDPGATAIDGFGTNISSDIVVAGDAVDVNTAGTYIITYNVSDAAGNAATQVTRTVIVAADTAAPVITLIGSATISVAVGGTFTDPGATAADNVDGNITSSIVVAGDVVDVNTAATYIITYNVSDAAGNAATQVTRTVIVVVGGGGGGTPGELAINGDFETGDTSGWVTFVDATGASFTASSTNPSSGSFSGNLISDFNAGLGGPIDAVVKQANLGAGGTALPNTQYVITFDLRGSASDGGVFFVEFFSELSAGGTSKAEIITGGPHPLSDTWTTYSYTVLTGSDVSGGITVQLKTSCGPVADCLVDVFFDNVSIQLK